MATDIQTREIIQYTIQNNPIGRASTSRHDTRVKVFSDRTTSCTFQHLMK